ncbi:hypothetical protein C8R44DRAFT_746188 [Mycena epipterygia]|nr:hypothetical protein C8R44DRAFT_746188 [Mycena epipterygia]
MTSGAKKEKARKKARAQKLLEEEQQRVEVETVQRASVSTPTSLITPATPIVAPSGTVIDDTSIHGIYDRQRRAWPAHPDSRPFFDTSTLMFYDNDTPQLPPPLVPVLHITDSGRPRDFSALRGIASTHPWRTIRRRNHRLFPQRREQRPFPRALPKRTVIAAPHTDILAILDHPLIVSPPLPPPREDRPPGLSLRPIDILGLWPLHPDDPIHPDKVPALDIPAPLICPCPADHLVLPVPALPAQTPYGLVRSALALACASEQPHAASALSAVFDIVWRPYPHEDDQNHLVELPGDHSSQSSLSSRPFCIGRLPTSLPDGLTIVAAKMLEVRSMARGRARTSLCSRVPKTTWKHMIASHQPMTGRELRVYGPSAEAERRHILCYPSIAKWDSLNGKSRVKRGSGAPELVVREVFPRIDQSGFDVSSARGIRQHRKTKIGTEQNTPSPPDLCREWVTRCTLEVLILGESPPRARDMRPGGEGALRDRCLPKHFFTPDPKREGLYCGLTFVYSTGGLCPCKMPSVIAAAADLLVRVIDGSGLGGLCNQNAGTPSAMRLGIVIRPRALTPPQA